VQPEGSHAPRVSRRREERGCPARVPPEGAPLAPHMHSLQAYAASTAESEEREKSECLWDSVAKT
jgi:hypothetical protein